MTGRGLGPNQLSGDFTDCTLEAVRKRALELARIMNVPVIYLSLGIAHSDT